MFAAMLLFCSFTGFAQSDKPVVDNSKLDEAKELSNITLPPLDEFFESARTSPYVTELDKNITINERELKSRKREWLTYLKLNASYNYGVTNSYLMYQETGIPSADKYAENANSYYILGAGISLPLYNITNFRNRLKQQEATIELQHDLLEQRYSDIKLKIVDNYFVAQSQINMIPHLMESINLANAQYEQAKIDFLNGKIAGDGLIVSKAQVVKAVQDFESSMSSLKQALYYLEIISNKKIINKK